MAKTGDNSVVENMAPDLHRKVYTPPQLTVHGNVEDMTRSGGLGNVDALNASVAA